MKILFIAPEVSPFAKTGGLADVAGSLPRALRQLGHDVRIIMPYYKAVEESRNPLRKGRKSVEVVIDGEPRKGLLRQSSVDLVTVYLIENREYFDRDGLYGTAAGDYPDNAQRFGFFCRAALEFLRRLDFRPDVLHLNDWQTGLVPVLLRSELKNDPFYNGIATLLTVHNLGYQGIFPPEVLSSLHLDPGLFSVKGMEYFGNVSFLKGGLLFADMINTVSPSYCREIQTPELGFGFDGILRQRQGHVHGILNGIDPKQWDPALSSALPASYDAADLKGKSADKRALQKELALEIAAETPIVSMVTRLDTQKGLDLVEEAFEELLKRDLQFILLGTGEQKHMEFFEQIKDRYPGRVAVRLTFDDALAQRIYAGSDIFLMPSHYEPCGLGQLIALRFGALPVVRRTGGLADTVVDPEEDAQNANGFLFAEASAAALLAALDRALALYPDTRAWRKMVRRGMTEDFSWNRSAQSYLDLYQKALEVRHAGRS
ncbi:MAG: glycogen synthase GlgA [Desulfuromonadales bacterium]